MSVVVNIDDTDQAWYGSGQMVDHKFDANLVQRKCRYHVDRSLFPRYVSHVEGKYIG